MARPTIYNEEYLEKAKEYIELCEDEDVQVVKQSNSEKGYEMYENKLKVRLPSIEGLARYINVNRDTIYAWSKVNQEFSDIIDELREKQAESLINNGLSGDYNPTIAKVLLSKHGYRDAQEVTGLDGKDLIPETLTQEEKEKLLTLIK